MERFRTRKTGELLAFLAYSRHRSRSREELTELLWPESGFKQASHSLSTALSSLRGILEPDEVRKGSVLGGDSATAWLNPELVQVDAWEFEELLGRAAKARAGEERLNCLREAVTLYRGPFLPGCYEDWALMEQRRLETKAVEALLELASAAEEAEDIPAAVDFVIRAAQFDPLREELQQRLVTLYRLGGQSAVVETAAARSELYPSSQSRPTAGSSKLLGSVAGANDVASRSQRFPALSGAETAQPRTPGRADEEAGGAVPLDSPYYVRRLADVEAASALSLGTTIVLIRGARQVGKTSLLARLRKKALEDGNVAVFADFQALGAESFATASSFVRQLARLVWNQVQPQLTGDPENPLVHWDEEDSPNYNFGLFVSRVLAALRDRRLVWCIDEIDRIFLQPYASDLFALFRSWHNEQAVVPEGVWSRLTMIIAYATEAHLFITDLNQSPFNVGVRLTLLDFSLDQARDLHSRFPQPLLNERDLHRLHELVGGHPYLLRRWLHLQASGQSYSQLENAAAKDDGPFGEHLRRMCLLIHEDGELHEAVTTTLRRHPEMAWGAFYRLRSAGVLRGDRPNDATFRCALYERYLRAHL